MDDELIHLAGREQVALVARMTRLGPARAAGRRALRARRGSWGITGGRARRIARVPLELEFKVGDARLEHLDLVEQCQHDHTDGGRSRLPVRWRNAVGWRKFVHGDSMNQQRDGVKRQVWPRAARLYGA